MSVGAHSHQAPAPLRPRPHQVQVLTDLTRALAVHDRTVVVMACGTGKTLVGRWHAQACEARRILVLLPSLGLVAQTLREWRRANHGSLWRFDALVVCSDPTTAEGAAERTGPVGDGVPVDSETWHEVAAQVTTSVDVAAEWLSATAERVQVVFATYHSSPVVATAQQRQSTGAREAFDLVICDEAHRLAGRPSAAFATVLDDAQIVARKRVFMTATPRSYSDRSGNSMADSRLFGPIAHTVTFGEAIESGLLADYQVVVVAAQGSAIETTMDTTAAALLRAIDRHDLRKILTFHSTVAKANAFAAGLDGRATDAGATVATRHVSGRTPAGTRAEALSWLAEPGTHQARIISNARCLSEGIDVPAVDAVAFVDQRTSTVDIIQAVGRALRPSPGKARGTILLPVAIDKDSDAETELSLSKFGHVWTVLRALRAHDQRFDTQVTNLVRSSLNPHRPAKRRHRADRVRIELPDLLSLPDVELRLVAELGSIWDRNYALLEQWSSTAGTAALPRGTKVEHEGKTVNLGEWAEQQRIAYRRGVLDPTRADLLEQVPGWVWDKAAARWLATLEVLETYAAENGTVAEHASGQSRFAGLKDAEQPRRDLGVWMATQRQAQRAGQLPSAQVAAIAALPGWTWDAGLSGADVYMVGLLRAFVDREGHAEVPPGHYEDGLPLDEWCWTVRRCHWTGTIEPALYDEIRAATPSQWRRGHFDWAKNATRWRIAYAALQQFAAREGAGRPSGRHVERMHDTSVGLGQWAALQRMNYRRGLLDETQIRQLEVVPGWQWEVDLQTVQPQPPIALPPGSRHGTPGAYKHGCGCADCLEWRRTSDRARLAQARDRISDPVPAEAAQIHLASLEAAGIKRGAITAASGLPLGVIRKVAKGTAMMEREHRDQLLATRVEACRAEQSARGSRGREVSPSNERIDSGPTLVLLSDLAERGFGIQWVSRELGYASGLQVSSDRRISRRIHDAVRDLYRKVGDRTMSDLPKNVRRPSLAELITAEQAATATGQAAVA